MRRMRRSLDVSTASIEAQSRQLREPRGMGIIIGGSGLRSLMGKKSGTKSLFRGHVLNEDYSTLSWAQDTVILLGNEYFFSRRTKLPMMGGYGRIWVCLL